VLLDNALGGRWYDRVRGRPAYRAVTDDTLARAVTLGEGLLAGAEDAGVLNRRSLAWRRAA